MNFQSDDGRKIGVTPASDVLAALRAATLERHRMVDRCMPLSRPDPTHADYIDHLLLMRTWLYPLEGWLDGPKTLQTALIDADLADAGVELEAGADVIRIGRAALNAGAYYRWGTRYVIEGSRLGAAVLYRQLRRALHPHKLRYLSGGDGPSADRWPQFLADLRTAVRTPGQIAAACQGACDSFDALLAVSARRQPGFQSAGEKA